MLIMRILVYLLFMSWALVSAYPIFELVPNNSAHLSTLWKEDNDNLQFGGMCPFSRISRSVNRCPYKNRLREEDDTNETILAYPRIGRVLPASSTTDYPEFQKRQVYTFPRVGRSHVPSTLNQVTVVPIPAQPQISLSYLFQPSPLPRPLFYKEAFNLNGLMKVMLRERRHSTLAVLKTVSGGTDTTGTSHMWFGPRLGRALKAERLGQSPYNLNYNEASPETAEDYQEKRQVPSEY